MSNNIANYLVEAAAQRTIVVSDSKGTPITVRPIVILTKGLHKGVGLEALVVDAVRRHRNDSDISRQLYESGLTYNDLCTLLNHTLPIADNLREYRAKSVIAYAKNLFDGKPSEQSNESSFNTWRTLVSHKRRRIVSAKRTPFTDQFAHHYEDMLRAANAHHIFKRKPTKIVQAAVEALQTNKHDFAIAVRPHIH